MSEPNWVVLGQSGVSIDYVGAWAAGTPYKTGDIVIHNGVQYIAVNPSTGQTPPAAWVPNIGNAQLPTRLQESGPVITDCDTATQSGWYVVNTSAANSPDGATYHLLQALRSDGLNSVRQIAYDYNGNRSWSRRMTSGTWTAWVPIGGVWQAYAVAWTTSGTPPVIGNGTLSGRYCQIGKLVYVNIHLVLGSTSTPGTGSFFFSLPVPDAAGVGSHGAGFLGGPATYQGALVRQEAGQQKVSVWQMIAANVTVGAAAPWAWAATHMIQASIAYEAA